ncbi:MAG: tol-pal system-associated acyl-CoA thioesterase [Pseudomonadota bacterium]
MRHTHDLRVYYEDTDLAGIVYYANYLKYIERARSEFVRDLGIDQTRLRQDDGIVFAVARIEADYKIPARFDDELRVQTSVIKVTSARLVLAQDVLRDGAVLFASIVTLAALSNSGRPARLPAAIRAALG